MKSAFTISFVLFSMMLSAQPRKVTFTRQPLTVGMKVTQEMRTEMNMTIGGNQGGETWQVEVGNFRHDIWTMNILELRGDTVTKCSVVYEKQEETSKNPMGTQSKEGAILGREYIVERLDTLMQVTVKDDKPISKAEEVVLQTEFRKPRMSGKFATLLAGRTFGIGEEIKLPPADANRLFEDQKWKSEVHSFVFILKEIRTEAGLECAVFDLKIELTGLQGELTLTTNFTGEVIVGIQDCWPLLMLMKGPITGVGETQGFAITGEGTVENMTRMTYVR